MCRAICASLFRAGVVEAAAGRQISRLPLNMDTRVVALLSMLLIWSDVLG